MAEKKFVVGIDFGTSGSTYCYCEDVGHIGRDRLRDIADGTFQKGWHYAGAKYRKAPTEVLINVEDDVIDWGFSARQEYYKLCRKHKTKVSKKYKLVENLKLCLLGEKDIYGVGGELVNDRIIEYVGEYLKGMKEDIIETMGKTHPKVKNVKSRDIKWVITIPTTYGDEEKRKMKKACVNAEIIPSMRISKDDFLFAFEPESACVYHFISKKEELKNESSYMIIDCGGGTIDFSTHKCSDRLNFEFQEITSSNGVNQGSTFVNKRFEQWMDQELKECGSSLEELKKKSPVGWVKLTEKFEQAKVSFNGESSVFIEGIHPKVVRFLTNLDDPEFEHIDEDEGIFEIDIETMTEFYRDCLHGIEAKILEQIEVVQEKGVKLDRVIGVGGFCDSNLVKDRIKRSFRRHKKIFRDQKINIGFRENVELVLRGTVVLGVAPSVISTRLAKRTYGVGMLMKFEKGVDDKRKLVVNETVSGKKKFAKDRFDAFVKRGEPVPQDKKIKMCFSPGGMDEKKMIIEIYSTILANPRYIDESPTIIKHKRFDLNIADIVKRFQTCAKVFMEVTLGEADLYFSFKAHGKEIATGKVQDFDSEVGAPPMPKEEKKKKIREGKGKGREDRRMEKKEKKKRRRKKREEEEEVEGETSEAEYSDSDEEDGGGQPMFPGDYEDSFEELEKRHKMFLMGLSPQPHGKKNKVNVPVVRLCPYCETLCEHNQIGCKHIKCSNGDCGFYFCLVCLRVPAEPSKTSPYINRKSRELKWNCGSGIEYARVLCGNNPKSPIRNSNVFPKQSKDNSNLWKVDLQEELKKLR